MNVRIFVSVGTDHHRFDRLIDWLDAWAVDRHDVEIVLQHGASRPSALATNLSMIGADDVDEQYRAADIAVSQVGPGTIADANAHGLRPLVVPRDPALDEVVDDHQFAFGEFMAAKNRCWCVTTQEDFAAQLDRLYTDASARRCEVVSQATETASNVAALVDACVLSPLPRWSWSRWRTMLRAPRGSRDDRHVGSR